MTVLKAKDIEAALLSKGFHQDNTHHKHFWLYVGGKQTGIKTHLSHGISDYGDPLLNLVKKEMRITKAQLMDFVECKLKYEGYLALLQEQGHNFR